MNEFEPVRQIPYSLEAEQAVLGAVLVNGDEFSEVAQILRSDDFYIEQHSAIYAAMQELFAQNTAIDYVTVISRLESTAGMSREESFQYVKRLADAYPLTSNLNEYARIIKNKSMLRRLIKAAAEITDSAFSAGDQTAAVIDSAEQKIFEIAQDKVRGDFSHIRDVIVTSYSGLEAMINDPESMTGVKTGFSDLDRKIVGFRGGDFVIVGARPGMGKTSFVLNIAENVARKTKKAVAVFSLEMSNEQLVLRMLSSSAMIDNYCLRRGTLTTNQWSDLAFAASSLSECDIYLDDTPGVTVTDMRAKLRRVKNLGLVVIDYLQLMSSERRYDNKAIEVGDITRNLKLMAKALDVPIICCAQLSRETEKRKESRPMLSDLRDSGTIEQDADAVLFIYRDTSYGDDNSPDGSANMAELCVAKNRHGETGVCKLAWYGQYYKFIGETKEFDEYMPGGGSDHD